MPVPGTRKARSNYLSDPFQANHLAGSRAHSDVMDRMKGRLREKMAEIDDTFEESLHYRYHWVSEDRRILRSATLNTPAPGRGR